MLKFDLPDWNWGDKGNKKLRKMFSIPEDQPMYKSEGLELFLEHIRQEMCIDQLVSSYLHYTPIKILVSEADAIGCYEINQDEKL
jgi:hypothetical protein